MLSLPTLFCPPPIFKEINVLKPRCWIAPPSIINLVTPCIINIPDEAAELQLFILPPFCKKLRVFPFLSSSFHFKCSTTSIQNTASYVWPNIPGFIIIVWYIRTLLYFNLSLFNTFKNWISRYNLWTTLYPTLTDFMRRYQSSTLPWDS